MERRLSGVAGVKWVKPYFGVQVDFWNSRLTGSPRHPVFRDICR